MIWFKPSSSSALQSETGGAITLKTECILKSAVLFLFTLKLTCVTDKHLNFTFISWKLFAACVAPTIGFFLFVLLDSVQKKIWIYWFYSSMKKLSSEWMKITSSLQLNTNTHWGICRYESSSQSSSYLIKFLISQHEHFQMQRPFLSAASDCSRLQTNTTWTHRVSAERHLLNISWKLFLVLILKFTDCALVLGPVPLGASVLSRVLAKCSNSLEQNHCNYDTSPTEGVSQDRHAHFSSRGNRAVFWLLVPPTWNLN